MSSYYLTEDAANLRRQALLERLSAEAVNIAPGGLTWPPESDFWLLPPSEQKRTVDYTVERLVKT